MALDRSDVEKIAHLARLAVAPDACNRYAQDLTNILDLVAQMDAVDTTGVDAHGPPAAPGPTAAPGRRH